MSCELSVETRDELIGSILADVGRSLRDLRCACRPGFANHGVSMTQLNVLWQLERQGPISMGQIADLLDVSLSTRPASSIEWSSAAWWNASG